MRIFLTNVLMLLSSALCAGQAADRTLTTVAEVRAFADSGDERKVGFSLRGTILYPYAGRHAAYPVYALDDGTGCTLFRVKGPLRPNPGDSVTISGHVPPHISASNDLVADATEITRHGPPPSPVRIAIPSLSPTRDNLKLVETEGFVEDVFDDDADSNWRIIQLRERHATLLVSMPVGHYEKLGGSKLLGARLRAAGPYCSVSSRRLSGWRLVLDDFTTCAVVTPAREDPLDAPALVMPRIAEPREIVALGRRSVTGRVRATWQKRHLLLDADIGQLMRIDLADGERVPQSGTRIKAAGHAETDLYHVNLSRACIRILEPTADSDEALPVSPLETADLHLHRNGRRSYNDKCFGRMLRADGIVLSVPQFGTERDFLYVNCDGIDLNVDVSACPESVATLAPGCRIAVSGVCILETENWRPTLPFPPITGVIVAVQNTDGLRLISRPSPWTTRRVLPVLGAAALLLIVLLAWNHSLQRLAERRGRALADESLARAESELKVYERTRLAVELHDSISQNLTGATMEMRVARELVGAGVEASRHIDLALKTVDATRTELRNCIWDLRNDALGLPDLGKAVRMTLAPLMGKASLVVRFAVPRERISDNTAHTILRILRELTTNAIRHGGAESVRVAGAIEGETLLFSVTDDGCGFDPDACPGMEDGHFGLEGVRERVSALGGKVNIESRPGVRHTRIAVSLTLPRLEQT